jgi:hypothetical protein
MSSDLRSVVAQDYQFWNNWQLGEEKCPSSVEMTRYGLIRESHFHGYGTSADIVGC